ncbi:hypothetical protein CEXT_424951 [Caerostris extrusa]|uniref:Uncharacterized protein n=1 Tax=Caerostris extrusa TaxID=172846 RepID=A0AAV4WSU3_CAEEX|nr:hypothetical protein CEXT_424951 [Caerostris extrusa]
MCHWRRHRTSQKNNSRNQLSGDSSESRQCRKYGSIVTPYQNKTTLVSLHMQRNLNNISRRKSLQAISRNFILILFYFPRRFCEKMMHASSPSWTRKE